MALTIDRIVRVTAQISPQGVLRREFGKTLLLVDNTDSVLAGSGPMKFQTYASADEVADAGWPAGSNVRQAAAVYFQQVPYPRNLVVGQWNRTAVRTRILGNPEETGDLTAFQGLAANTTLTITLIRDGAPDEESATIAAPATTFTSLASVAARMQTLLRTIDTSVDDGAVTYNSIEGRFEIEVDVDANVTAATVTISAGGTASVISGLANLTQALPGSSAESVEDALETLEGEDADFYFVTLDHGLETANEAVVRWVASRNYMFSASFGTSPQLPDAEPAADTAEGRLVALEPERTWATWSRADDFKHLSAAGRFSSVNFSANDSIITGKFKELPGTLADDLTTTQKDLLDRVRVNHYSPFSGDNIYAEGWTLKPGTFIDVRYWLDWFVNAVQTGVYNLLRQTPGRVPQTPDGISAVRNVVEGVCRQGARNGGIAPGRLSEALAANIRRATGADDFDGFLSSGYLVHIGDIALQDQAERATRASPPVTVWVKGSGAIHSVDVAITFEN